MIVEKMNYVTLERLQVLYDDNSNPLAIYLGLRQACGLAFS